MVFDLKTHCTHHYPFIFMKLLELGKPEAGVTTVRDAGMAIMV